MGVVYRAFDPVIKRAVALKTIRKELLADEEEAVAFAARFRNEAQAAGRLLHPGIVAVYEYGEEAHFAFIAMEYVEGISLRQYFERQIRFEESDVVSIMVQLLEALQYAHDQGVWHRDIKPANIIIMNNGRIKVTDFGIARVDSSTLTRVGSVMGTPGFIAPEQYLGTEVDHRVDIFAAGVVFYELLTGKPPFSGSTEGVIYKVCYEPALPLSVMTGKASLARFDAIAMRALAKNPQDRYPSAHKFRADLLAAYHQPVSPTISQETLIRDAVPAIAAAEVPTPRNVASAGWQADKLGAVERSLVDFVGPVGRIMVRDAAREAKDFASLLHTLADCLPFADRDKFLRQNEELVAAGDEPSAMARLVNSDATAIPDADNLRPPTLDEIVLVTRLLIDYLGPFAQILVQEATRAGASRSTFLARATSRLTESEKQRFLHDFEQSK
jgi:predicted Ser/Thr protein kinase